MRFLLAALIATTLTAAASADDAEESTSADIALSAQMFAGYGYFLTDGESFNEFELSRSEAGIEMAWDDRYGGEVRLEAIRSAGPGSLVGIDGDSLVVRMKRAWAYGRWPMAMLELEARGGLVPDPWVETLEAHYDTRGLSPTGAELSGLLDTSDLGFAAKVTAFEGFAVLHVLVSNGEGRNLREQNSGKNTSGVLSIRPLQLEISGAPAALRLHLMGRDGSVGAGSARDARVGGALTFDSLYYYGGVEYVRALGAGGVSSLRTDVLSAWISAELWRERLGVVGRYDQINQDLSANDAVVRRITGGVYVNLLPAKKPNRLRLYLAGQQDLVGADASPAPGGSSVADTTRVLVVLSASGARMWSD